MGLSVANNHLNAALYTPSDLYDQELADQQGRILHMATWSYDFNHHTAGPQTPIQG